MRNGWLLGAGLLDLAAAIAHLGCIVGGPSWYRFFGAGARIVREAERGLIWPALITLLIAGVLSLWGAYALSGAGVIARLPLLRAGLVTITAIYLLRAAAYPLMLRTMHDRTPAFLAWSSAIVLGIGLVHLIGLVRGWRSLG